MGRRSGGLLLLVKKQLEKFVSKIELSVEHILALKISKEFIYFDQDVVVVFVYIRPQGAVHYRDSDSNCHIAALDSCLLDITERFPEAHIVFCGDFNASIQINNHPTDLSTGPRNSVLLFQYSRSSCDGTINDSGERLLYCCACFDLLILNGCKQGDEKGHFTYVSTHGCSVIYYCLVSDIFVDIVAKFAVCDRVESQHMPILFKITCAQGQSTATVMHPVERVV